MANVKIFLKSYLAVSLVFMLGFTGCKSDDDSGDTPKTVPSPASATYPTLAKYDFDSVAEFLYQGIKLCHPKMKEVWPGDSKLSEDNFNLILVEIPENPEAFNFEDKEAVKNLRFYFINDKEKSAITNLPDKYTQLPMGVMSSGFLQVPYNGKNACAIAFFPLSVAKKMPEFANSQPEGIARDYLDTFYHESFHSYVQGRDWGSADSKDRDQLYPIDFTPRTYRILSNLNLIQAYKNFDDSGKRAEYYSRAKFWLEKYKADYSAEAAQIKINDINEGTANYFGKAVCGSIFPNTELFENVDSDSRLSSTIDGESYSLGSISINLIRKEGKLSDAVAAFKQDSSTPIEFLLQDVSAPAGYSESSEAELKNRINTAQEKELGANSERGKKLQKLADDFLAGGKIYLVDYNSFSSSSISCVYNTSIAGFENLAGINAYLLLTIESVRTTVSGVNCLLQNFKLPGNNDQMIPTGFAYYMLPLAAVDFTEDAEQPSETGALSIGIGEKRINGSPESAENLTEVKKGKISSITQLSEEGSGTIILKDYGKNAAVFKGKDSKNNTYYIFEELPTIHISESE